MARFYLHLRNGTEELLDPEGIEYRDLKAAEVAALASARDVMIGDLGNGIVDLRYWIDVEDVSGRVVHTVRFDQAVRILNSDVAPAAPA